MSDRIRKMLKERQDAELAFARFRRPIDLDQAQESLQGNYDLAQLQNELSPIKADDDVLKSLYSSILGPSMAQQIIEQYLSNAGRTIQQDIGEGEGANLMRPMISSVMQLDR
jgi:hypothetical protein